MKALLKTQKGNGFLEIRDVPEPRPKAGEVKIEVAACGVCGTDIHVRHDQFPYWPPVILGLPLGQSRPARRGGAAHPGLRRLPALPYWQYPDLPA